jgi:hypothetical protein
MGTDGGEWPPDDDLPSDEEIVRTAAEAAEDLVFSRLDGSNVDDLDVTVTFEEGILELDVYVNADAPRADPNQVAEDAVLAGRAAADELLE